MLRKIFVLTLVLALALSASIPYHNNMIKMRRALLNELSFDSTDGEIPPFDPAMIDGWDEMTPEELEQTREIYNSFVKLAHLMEDWAAEFELDMAKYDDSYTEEKVPVKADGYRPDTGSRTEYGWRRNMLVEGTTRGANDPITTNGANSYNIHDDSYVPVGTNPYPEEPKKHTVMDDSNEKTRAPLNPAVPKLHAPVPNEIDLSNNIVKPSANPGPAPQWVPVEEVAAPALPAPEEPKTHIEYVSPWLLPEIRSELVREELEWENLYRNYVNWEEQQALAWLLAYNPYRPAPYRWGV